MTRQILAISVIGVMGVLALLGCRSMLAQPGGSDDFLVTGLTASGNFQAFQIDPRAEDSAGPQFIATGDFDNDGFTDLASAWNESQPIQIHIQERAENGAIVFATIPVGGTTPIARVSGLKVADLDQDGFDDIVVLVKDTGLVARCDQSREDCDVTNNGGVLDNALDGIIVTFFNPGDVYNEPWTGNTLSQSNLAGTDEGELPEEGGYTSLDIGDIDGVNGPDIVVTHNSPEGEPPNVDPPPSSVFFFPNPGLGAARNGEAWSRITIHADMPEIGDCHIADVDGDGDSDVVVTLPPAKNSNVRWLPNPLSLGQDGNVRDMWPEFAPVGQVATEANILAVGDIDGDGLADIVVRSTDGKIVQWFKKPASPSQTFIRNPWQVYSIAEFAQRPPGAIALGDLTGDGQLDAAISAGGAVAWFSKYPTGTLFDFWQEHLIIDDDPSDSGDAGSGGLLSVLTDPNAGQEETGTFVNAIIVEDIDGDGVADIVATLDRNALSGLSNDALVLFRNTSQD